MVKIEEHCWARSGTFFYLPVQQTLDTIMEDIYKEIQVILITDSDDVFPERTKVMADDLKKELCKKNIYSKFSVLGLGEHDSNFLGMMADFGT